MPRKRSPTLTDGELRLMNVLWDRGEATVADVVAALPGRERVAYTTAQTLLRILEAKGYVAHRKAGRAFVFRPLVDRRQARRRALGHLVNRLFGGSREVLIQNVLDDERLAPSELKRLKKLIGSS
jgi:predicted transcriptional regulator